MINKVLYLGPVGSYSDIAKEKFKACFSPECSFILVESIYKIIRMLKEGQGESLAAILPIENSIEGIVRDTQDNLVSLAKLGFRVQAESLLQIEHSLISFGDISEVKVIRSHPQALAQCREYIFKKWGDDIKLEQVLSTSGAVQELSSDKKYVAAIANNYCADLYQVPVLDSRINDEENNTTRFVLISKEEPKFSQKGKTSITFSTENEPGALNKVLTVFEKFGLNMTYIDSRPSRKEMGEYIFYVDFIGNLSETNVSMALVEIQPYLKNFEILSKGAICV